jgi:glycosyltransferase involved in cell wall biosynthesis
VVEWAHRHGRKVVYSTSNEIGCRRSLPHLTSLRERLLYRHGVRHADAIVVQSRTQQRLLAEEFGRTSTLIPMPCDGVPADADAPVDPPRPGGGRVLWVGRLHPVKRLDWLLEIARRCPEITFDVVGSSNEDSGYAAALVRQARSLPNVRLHGRVLHREMTHFYRRASLLCNTSVSEGFPNVFLEAWSAGLPVVSTVDPDGVIAAHGLGGVGPTPDRLAQRVREITASPADWRRCSDAARAYVRAHHALSPTMSQFEQVFQDLTPVEASIRPCIASS